jgi:hypothetical protein
VDEKPKKIKASSKPPPVSSAANKKKDRSDAYKEKNQTTD